MIRIRTYQAASEDIRWAYEPVADLCPDIEPVSESSNYWSSDEGIKDQYNTDYQEQGEALLVPRRNPRNIRRSDQRALIQLKSGTERSKNKLFFITHIVSGSTQENGTWYRWICNSRIRLT